jgi:peptide/nickel transport system permease protein
MSNQTNSTGEAAPSPSGLQQFWARLRRQKPAVVALAFLLFVAVLAIAAPLLAPYDPAATHPARRLEGPSGEFWLGTDDLGRDMLSRHIYAARVSLYAAGVAVGVALALSLPVGLASGYFGGRLDSIVQRLNDGLMSFPGLILAISIIGILGPGLTNAMVAIGISYTPFFIRIIRGATLAVREEVYMEAAHQIGSPHGRTIVRHVLPNILSPLIVQTTLALGLAILSEAALSFLGLGIPPPASSWGGMLDRAFSFMYSAPLNVITPGIAIMAVVLAFNVLGDGIRDSFGRQVRRGD